MRTIIQGSALEITTYIIFVSGTSIPFYPWFFLMSFYPCFINHPYDSLYLWTLDFWLNTSQFLSFYSSHLSCSVIYQLFQLLSDFFFTICMEILLSISSSSWMLIHRRDLPLFSLLETSVFFLFGQWKVITSPLTAELPELIFMWCSCRKQYAIQK